MPTQRPTSRPPADLLQAEKKNPDLKLVSTRSWKEYIGDISGYSYIKEAGEPKGAICGRVSKSSSDVAYLTNADGTIKDPKAELAYWAKKGITPDQEVVFYMWDRLAGLRSIFSRQGRGL